MARVYIAREIYPNTGTGWDRIDSEAVFSTFEAAESYVKGLEPEKEPGSHFQIVAHLVGDNPGQDPWGDIQYWHHDVKHNLMEHYDAKSHREKLNSEFVEKYRGKFKVGDVVKIKSAYNLDIESNLGVIQFLPGPYERKDWGEQEDGSFIYYEPGFRVEYLDNVGRLEHDHLYEEDVELFEDELPERLAFLQLLSDHYKGKRQIKEKALYDLEAGNMIAKDVRRFGEEDLEDPT